MNFWLYVCFLGSSEIIVLDVTNSDESMRSPV